MPNKPEEYEIGYRKPPKEGRFEKGKSGNPKGRPKGSKNLVTTFHEVTQELIHITENGKSRRVTKLYATMLQVANQAISGNLPAAKEVLQWTRTFEEFSEREDLQNPDVDKEEAIMTRLIKRIRSIEMNGQDDSAENEEVDEEKINDDDQD